MKKTLGSLAVVLALAAATFGAVSAVSATSSSPTSSVSDVLAWRGQSVDPPEER